MNAIFSKKATLLFNNSQGFVTTVTSLVGKALKRVTVHKRVGRQQTSISC
jgi:hypothetical protein